MPRVSLRHILSKKNNTESLLLSFITAMNAQVIIADENHNYLLGRKDVSVQYSYPVNAGDEILGWVNGDEKSIHIASLLSLLAQKELERKNLGNEVLTLYQEVNMVFNFSEKLAQAIEPVTIAQIAVNEAMHLIHATSGVVVLWDENRKQLHVPATAGDALFNEQNLAKHTGVLLKIGLSGQSDIMDDLTTLRKAEIIDPAIRSIIYAALKVNHRIMGAIILAGDQPAQFAASDLKFLITLALQSSSAIESALLYEKNIREAREREEAIRHVYEIAAKFVPYEFIGSLGHAEITDVKLGDQVEKNVTVLFTDIRDYTSLSEQMTPEENFQFVSAYNELMGPIIRNRHGFINQYLGDAIMALFPENAETALIAAIEMQHRISAFNIEQKLRNAPTIKMGIGMHSGPLIMGITGDDDRLDATTISDTVNTSSRIESLTKYYKANILLSETTKQQIQHPENFHLRYLGKVKVKGRVSSADIYECFNSDSDEQIEKKEETLRLFNEGIMYYLDKSFKGAIKCFIAVTEINAGDKTAQFFLEHSMICLQKGVPEDWSGVLEMATK